MPTFRKKLFIAGKMISGLLTYVPPLHRTLLRLRESLTGHSLRQTGISTAPYCYTVWMRHFIQSYAIGPHPFPKTVIEIGPGNSLGVGLAALLCGVDRYYALDAVSHLDFSKHSAILDDLLQMFLNKTPIPDHESFPDLGPPLPSHAFPNYLLPHVNKQESLSEDRLLQIRKDLHRIPAQGCNQMLFYLIGGSNKWPSSLWGSADWILSQFAMEHIDDLPGAYKSFYDLLKPGGIMTHHVDFRAHWTSYEWNGYWTYGDRTWQLIRGRRPYFINRAPLSEHLSCLTKAGFEVLEVTKAEGINEISRAQLASRFRNLTEEDLQTVNAMIAVRKP